MDLGATAAASGILQYNFEQFEEDVGKSEIDAA